jgi:hypothetical protein
MPPDPPRWPWVKLSPWHTSGQQKPQPPPLLLPVLRPCNNTNSACWLTKGLVHYITSTGVWGSPPCLRWNERRPLESITVSTSGRFISRGSPFSGIITSSCWFLWRVGDGIKPWVSSDQADGYPISSSPLWLRNVMVKTTITIATMYSTWKFNIRFFFYQSQT